MKKRTISNKPGSDLERLSEITDDEIDTSEILEISPEEFARAVVRRGLEPAAPKVQLTIRIDREVLEWFRGQGHGYHTRINTLLRAYMEAHKKRDPTGDSI